jgi:beta-glucanase (GH16 family)
MLVGFLLSGNLMAAEGRLLWSDEFNRGPIPDPNVWSHDVGNWGWGNRELQNYTSDRANARVRNGHLLISVLREPSAGSRFSSARLRSQDKLTFKYGTIEARIRVPDLADGLWPALWTLGNNFSEVGWPACGELDILEMGHRDAISDGVVNRRVGSAAHWERGGSYALFSDSLDAGADLNEDYHVWRMEWTPNSVATFIDDKRIWIMDISEASCADCEAFHQPHFLVLNVAVGGSYPGIYTPSGITAAMPASMLVDYVRIYDNGYTELGGSALDSIDPVIDAGHAGAWFYPPTSGQGQFIDIDPESQFMFLGWFTYTPAESDSPNEQHWYTAQGHYVGDTAVLELHETLGGRFDNPQAVETVRVGEAVLSFDDCEAGIMYYRFDDDSREGAIPLERVIPGSGNLCTQLLGPAPEAVDINRGMDGGWFDPATSGQGFFFDVHTDGEDERFIFAAWFTYGDDTASGQRWLTAQGSFEASVATIDVHETTGGSFDDPTAVETVKVGTMTIDFADCETAELTYSLDDAGLDGEIDIIRVVPGTQRLCEALAGPR